MNKTLVTLLSILFLFSFTIIGQDGNEEKKPEKVEPPQSQDQAVKLFTSAWKYEKEQSYKEALESYQLVLDYFRKNDEEGNNRNYVIDVLNNMGGVYAKIGRMEDATSTYKQAMEFAALIKDYNSASQFHHKLGIIYGRLAQAKEREEEQEQYIYPNENAKDPLKILMSKGTYTRLIRTGQNFVANRIELDGSRNPFEKRRELYSKLFNVKIRDEFDPDTLITPDTVELVIQVKKRGYFPVSRARNFMPEMEYDEINETMITIPRKVKPEVTEDFYRQGLVSPDEITLTPIIGNRITGKPVRVSDKEPFKPGKYQLVVKKAGYNPLREELTIYPGEGNFTLRRELRSKMRNINYRIQSDFTIDTSEVEPDEITMNGQVIYKDSKVKPGEYKLVIRKEGYEPVVKQSIVEPEETPYRISEFMRTLPREVIFEIASDYSGERLTPDEITFNSRPIKYGDSVRPDAYRIVVRKKGYSDIVKNVVIYPKSEPYVLKETMKSLPRNIRVALRTSFPKNSPVFNYECTLNGKNATDAFKPGEYELSIKSPGYQELKKKVNITPSNLPYEIKETLQPKAVPINLAVSYDIPPEDPSIETEVTLVNEDRSDIIELKDGSQVQPQYYTLKVERPGYDPFVTKQTILPSENPFQIKLRLNASMRGVLARVTAEYPPQQNLIPDEITIDNKPLTKDFKLKPGVHDLVILKEGYRPIRKPIKVLASQKDFFVIEEMETRSRLVSFEFLDSYDRRQLSPNNITLAGEKIAHNAPQNLKPGEYQLEVELRGYASLSETISIPVGAEGYKIERFMRAIKRDVIVDITGDYEADKKLIPDIFTLGDTRIAGNTSITPGIFDMVLQKAGYYPVLKRITINPDPKPYVIKERMISKPRQLQIDVKSAFSQDSLVPDDFVIGTQNVKDGEEIKPGNYALVIKKSGYRTLSDQIEIQPSEEPYNLERMLDALPRLVKYEIVDEQDNPIIPDVINLDEKILDQKTAFMPGQYDVKVEKLGFETRSFEILIEPGEQPYVIQTRMASLPREIELLVNGEFPPEPLDPEVAALNGRDVREEPFKPGTYELEIQQSGFLPIKETITITPGEQPYLIEKTLKVKPRVIEEEISYDVLPPEGIGPHKITVADPENPKSERVVASGDKIKPGVYKVRIEKEAYRTLETRKYCWPMEGPFKISEQLVAKQVEVHIDISYDVEPPSTLPDYTCSLIDINTGIARVVQHGKRVKPGSYYLMIERPGYDFGARKEISILPSEMPYQITERLLAKPRNLSFEIVSEDNVLIPANEIIDKRTKAKVDFNQKFPAGNTVDLIIKFKKYATVSKEFLIEPGQGPFIATVPLTELKKYEFQTRQDALTMDDIKYPFSLAADGKPIEDHLIKKEAGLGRTVWTVWVGADSKNLQVYAGYKYIQKNFRFIGLISRLPQISARRLIEHLERVSNKDSRGPKAALIVMEQMLRSFSNKRELRKAHSRELESLVQYVEGWKLNAAQERMRKQTVIEQIRKLIK